MDKFCGGEASELYLYSNTTCMPEVVCAFVGLDALEDATNFPPEPLPVPLHGVPQPVLELGEHLFDQVRSGLYGGRNRSSAPSSSIVVRTASLFCGSSGCP